MVRLSRWSIVAMLLTGCASVPPPAPDLEVPAGAPWGLAWIAPSGEVAIRAGAVEHVLYPNASKPKAARTTAPTWTDAPSSQPRAAGSKKLPKRTPPTSRLLSDPATRSQCELATEAVPAWFFSRTGSRAPHRFGGDAKGCAVSP